MVWHCLLYLFFRLMCFTKNQIVSFLIKIVLHLSFQGLLKFTMRNGFCLSLLTSTSFGICLRVVPFEKKDETVFFTKHGGSFLCVVSFIFSSEKYINWTKSEKIGLLKEITPLTNASFLSIFVWRFSPYLKICKVAQLVSIRKTKISTSKFYKNAVNVKSKHT